MLLYLQVAFCNNTHSGLHTASKHTKHKQH